MSPNSVGGAPKEGWEGCEDNQGPGHRRHPRGRRELVLETLQQREEAQARTMLGLGVPTDVSVNTTCFSVSEICYLKCEQYTLLYTHFDEHGIATMGRYQNSRNI